MSKMYAYMNSVVYRPSETQASATGASGADAKWFAAELNTLLARAEAAEKRAEQAERDRDVLGYFCRFIVKTPEQEADRAAALSRCTPPASKEATNG